MSLDYSTVAVSAAWRVNWWVAQKAAWSVAEMAAQWALLLVAKMDAKKVARWVGLRGQSSAELSAASTAAQMADRWAY